MSEPQQIIRSDAIFIGYEAKRALNMLAKAKGLTCTDELAQQVLSDWLAVNHPEVMAHIRAIHKADDDFKAALKARINPDPLAAKP